MRRLLGKTSSDSPTGNDPLLTPEAPRPIPTAYRPSQAQDAVYSAGVPISCFDVSPDNRLAVLGGPHILSTVILDGYGDAVPSSGFGFSQGIDLRSAITAGKTAHPRAGLTVDQLNIRDIRWHGSATIFTACASGKIFAYDLARLGSGGGEPIEYLQMQEDSRQVNTLDVNPHLKSWLLSGSQDGTARVFDVSKPFSNRSGGLTFRQRFAPLRCIDSVRQVKWSPKVGHELACCTEAGVVLKWDVRQPSRPLLRINAHDKACSAIAWHPDGVHLASAGWDTRLHVWDLGSLADKRQKAKYTIFTPAPVAAISWRPGLWSATAQARRLAQIAVTYDETSNRRYGFSAVHIWDLARPTMPYKELERFDSSPSAIAWRDQDLLWTAGQDGCFHQCDVAFAPKVIDRQTTSTMAFSPSGDVIMFLEERAQSQRLRPSVTHQPDVSHRPTYGSGSDSRLFSTSKSDSEEEVVGSFLGPHRRTARSRQKTKSRSSVPASITPPSGLASSDDAKLPLGLEQSIGVTGMFKTQQVMAFGHLPMAKTVHVYQSLSSAYLEILKKELPWVEGAQPLVMRVGSIMEQFAQSAESAGFFRLSQTWRILAHTTSLLLNRRAQYHLELRVGRGQISQVEEGKGSSRHKASDTLGNGNAGSDVKGRRLAAHRGATDNRFHPARSLLTDEIESTSNVPTPIARPVDAQAATGADKDGRPYYYGRKLTPIVEPMGFDLGPSAHGSFKEADAPRDRLYSGAAESIASQDSEQSETSITEGYDFYDAETLVRAIDVPMPKKDSSWSQNREVNSGGEMKNNSGDSFGQVFSISAGTKGSVARTPSSGDAFARPSLMRERLTLNQEAAGSMEETDDASIRAADETQTSTSASWVSPSRDSGGERLAESLEGATPKSSALSQSQPSFTSQSDSAGFTEAHVQNGHAFVNADKARDPSPSKEFPAASDDRRPHIVENDYLPWDNDAPYPYPLRAEATTAVAAMPSPVDPYSVLAQALEFEARTSALNASAIILLLRPLVPEGVIDSHQASAILRHHHSRLMRMGLVVEAALLRNMCVRGWPDGLPNWGCNYAAIFSPAQQGVKAGLFCSACRKPREVDPAVGEEAVWTCERCSSVMAPCAVCQHRQPEQPAQMPEEVVEGPRDTLSEWWYCPGCAHGGHASCLQMWHAALGPGPTTDSSAKYSDGCCPSDGCGHACLPGRYRGEAAAARADERGRAAVEGARSREDTGQSSSRASTGPGGSRSSPQGVEAAAGSLTVDAHDVPPSRAVGMAREALNRAAGGSGGGPGILSSSPGHTPGGSGERDRRKSVKFAGASR